MNRRPPPILLGDAAALDFLNSLATPVDVQVDWLHDGEGLLQWLEHARLVSHGVLREVRATALPGELDKIAAQARSLREWFRDFIRRRHGRPLRAEDFAELKPLNRLLERDDAFRQIVPGPADQPGFALKSLRRWRSPEALLLPIGEALAEFVCTEDFAHVKPCKGRSCTLLFVDRTRRHNRRWCSMAICGNRAKQAAHRHRHRAPESPAPNR